MLSSSLGIKNEKCNVGCSVASTLSTVCETDRGVRGDPPLDERDGGGGGGTSEPLDDSDEGAEPDEDNGCATLEGIRDATM